MADYVVFNNKMFRKEKVCISPDNRSFRYGDGFFETMKMINGKIILSDYHFERLFASLKLLQFETPNHFTIELFQSQIIELAKKNNHLKLARIRLTVFRGDGSLYDVINTPNYLIQTWQLNNAVNHLNNNGLVVDIYPDAFKSCDKFSNVKSNNYLPYVMAALWVKENNLNDALVLNTHNRIAEATIANVFIIQDGIIKTPALTEGCINGIIRKYLLECFDHDKINYEQTNINNSDITKASEVFLTNAINGIRWVKQIKNTNYKNELTQKIYNKFIQKFM